MKHSQAICLVLILVWLMVSVSAECEVNESISHLPAEQAVKTSVQTPALVMTITGGEQRVVFKGHSLTPPGGRETFRVLYAPSDADDVPFRTLVNWKLDAIVDYFDARVETPSVETLSQYDLVFTWVNYSPADRVLFGDNLAAYVDAGGTVILGQWCLPTHPVVYLEGAIMDPAYCPATASSYESGGTYNYNGDGTDCVFDGFTTLTTHFFDVVTPVEGALWDGTFDDISNSPAVVWRTDRRVYYSPGNMALAGNEKRSVSTGLRHFLSFISEAPPALNAHCA